MNHQPLTAEAVRTVLATVNDPELHEDLVSLGMVKDVTVEDCSVNLTIELTTPACPMKNQIKNDIERALRDNLEGVGEIHVQWAARVRQDQRLQHAELAGNIKNIVAISSGKGGVGKSTVAVNLAAALARSGCRVGLLDADIYGPNVPTMLGITERPQGQQDGDKLKMVPPERHGIQVVSMGFMIPADEAVVWRGPMIHTALRQFFTDVLWDELDYLLVDMPPGTGDAQLSVAQLVPLSGAVIVTTPQDVALQDASRGVDMFHKVNARVLGVVENMSYYVCPNCGHEAELFSRGGGAKAAARLGLPFLGEVPMEIGVRECGDAGTPVVVAQPETAPAKALSDIAEALAAQLAQQAMRGDDAPAPETAYPHDPGPEGHCGACHQ